MTDAAALAVEHGLEKAHEVEEEDGEDSDEQRSWPSWTPWSLYWSSDSDVGIQDAFDSDDDDDVLKACFPINYATQRPNALHSTPNNSTISPFSNLVRLAPLQVQLQTSGRFAHKKLLVFFFISFCCLIGMVYAGVGRQVEYWHVQLSDNFH